MTHAYSELYTGNAMRVLAGMFDYAGYDLHYDADEFMSFFLYSGIAEQFSRGNPKYVVGMSGEEVAGEVLFRVKKVRPDVPYTPRNGRTDLYWAGYALAYYEWFCGDDFAKITSAVPMKNIVLMYDKYHEMDLERFVFEMNRLRRLSAYARGISLMIKRKEKGLSQSDLAEITGVSVRTIQQYEQRQKDINRAAAETVGKFAAALDCSIEELLE